MSIRNKFADFKFENITFLDYTFLQEFLTILFETYGEHVICTNGEKVKRQGAFGLFSVEQRKMFSELKIIIEIDYENNRVTLRGCGHRNNIFGMEFWLREMYDAMKIISYYPWDNCQRNIDDIYFEDPEVHRRKWDEEQKQRLASVGLLCEQDCEKKSSDSQVESSDMISSKNMGRDPEKIRKEIQDIFSPSNQNQPMDDGNENKNVSTM